MPARVCSQFTCLKASHSGLFYFVWAICHDCSCLLGGRAESAALPGSAHSGEPTLRRTSPQSSSSHSDEHCCKFWKCNLKRALNVQKTTTQLQHVYIQSGSVELQLRYVTANGPGGASNGKPSTWKCGWCYSELAPLARRDLFPGWHVYNRQFSLGFNPSGVSSDSCCCKMTHWMRHCIDSWWN